MYLGVALLKLGSHGTAETKAEAMLDSLHSEWSPKFNKFILSLLHSYQQYRSSSVNKSVSTNNGNMKLLINVSLTNFNQFFITENFMHIILRFNSINFDYNEKKSIFNMNGFKMSTVKVGRNHYTCLRSEDIKTYSCYIELARIEKHNNDIKVSLSQEVVVFWSTNLHLKVITLFDEIEVFISRVKNLRTTQNNMLDKQNVPNDSKKGKFKENYVIQLSGNVALHVKISQNHNMKVSLDNIIISNINDDFSIENLTTVIDIDDADIFTFEGLKMHRIKDNKDIREERYNSEGFKLDWNKTWEVTINLFKARFPYFHDCADAIQNEFVSIFKWLKLVHKKAKKPVLDDGPLPSDLLINIKEFLFEMSDDPFEVRLRDNYELLEDEYKESLKRQKMLDARVTELCKQHLHLPAGKVEELYASLNKKNAEIYVQRSKQMYRAVPMRTRLFAWCMSDVKIIALADISIHGRENVVKVMKEMDPESPWPEEGLDFTILWCRSVSMSCNDWKFQLRDFPQPLLDIAHLHLFGRLVGAEQDPPRRAKRSVSIDLGEPWGEIFIDRGMTPLKFYHDFNCEIQHFSYAFGPCWEPVIAQCNLSK